MLFLSALILCSIAFSGANKLKSQTQTSQELNPAGILNTVVSFRAYIPATQLLRHSRGSIFSQEGSGTQFEKDSSFTVRKALNGRAGYVSFESVNTPGHYIHSIHHMMILSTLSRFKKPSLLSFKIIPAVNGKTDCISLESSASPGQYITRSGSEVRMSPLDSSPNSRNDASWHIVDKVNNNLLDKLIVKKEDPVQIFDAWVKEVKVKVGTIFQIRVRTYKEYGWTVRDYKRYSAIGTIGMTDYKQSNWYGTVPFSGDGNQYFTFKALQKGSDAIYIESMMLPGARSLDQYAIFVDVY